MTESEQARADAIADAETLRQFMRDEVWQGHTTYVVCTPVPIGPNSAREFAKAVFRLVPDLAPPTCSAGVKGCGILFDEHGHSMEGGPNGSALIVRGG